jgi:hypothetical protein
MTKKILIASSNPWSFSVAVERDIAQMNRSARVDVANLFRLCSSTSPHWRRRDVFIERLNRKIERFVIPAVNGRDITGDIALDPGSIPAPPETVEAISHYRLGEAHVGLAVLSSATSVTLIQNPGSLSEYGPALDRAWRSAHLSWQVGRAVREMGYDETYIFNGRLCYSRPYCEEMEASAAVYRYEQGATGNSYIQAAAPIHDPRTMAKLIFDHDFSPRVGEEFYDERFRRAPGSEVSFFTSGQVSGLVPEVLRDRPYVAFFTSSSDEMFWIKDGPNFGQFSTQVDLALCLAEICRRQGKTLAIRMHPHLQYKHESWLREWDLDRLRELGVVVLLPTDPCDSYALARSSHCVVACGSTLGFECSYLGIPNAEVGDWNGGRIGMCPVTDTAEELAGFVERPFLLPEARDRALLYGSFCRRAGKRLPELDVGRHPNFARLDGRIVDPVRAAFQKAKELLGKGSSPLSATGKIILEPGIQKSFAERSS